MRPRGIKNTPWTRERLEMLRRLRNDDHLSFEDVADIMGMKYARAHSAYCYYQLHGLKKLPANIGTQNQRDSTLAGIPDNDPIFAGGRVCERVPSDKAITRPDAPPPSPMARRYNNALSEEITARIASQGLTAGLFGDPPVGRSALDQKARTN